MLRASIEFSGSEASVDGIAQGARAGDAGIEHGGRLLAFVDAVMGDDPTACKTAREALQGVGGPELVVDAAAVLGNFERMVRIADGTGIPLDGMAEVISSDLQSQLGLDRFASRRTAPKTGIARRLSPFFRPLVHSLLRHAGKRSRRRGQD